MVSELCVYHGDCIMSHKVNWLASYSLKNFRIRINITVQSINISNESFDFDQKQFQWHIFVVLQDVLGIYLYTHFIRFYLIYCSHGIFLFAVLCTHSKIRWVRGMIKLIRNVNGQWIIGFIVVSTWLLSWFLLCSVLTTLNFPNCIFSNKMRFFSRLLYKFHCIIFYQCQMNI